MDLSSLQVSRQDSGNSLFRTAASSIHLMNSSRSPHQNPMSRALHPSSNPSFCTLLITMINLSTNLASKYSYVKSIQPCQSSNHPRPPTSQSVQPSFLFPQLLEEVEVGGLRYGEVDLKRSELLICSDLVDLNMQYNVH